MEIFLNKTVKVSAFLLLIAFLAGGMLSFPRAVEAASNSGLLGYWSFNEATSTVATDFSGNGRHGTLSGDAVTWTNGKRGSALQFGGTNDNVNLGQIPALSGQQKVTVSAWIYDTGGATSRSIISRYTAGVPSFVFHVSDPGEGGADDMQFNPDGGEHAYTTGNLHQTNRWEHWVVVYDGSQADANKITFYLDGIARAETLSSTPVGVTTDSSTNVFRIGADSDEAVDFIGRIDEVRVYNRALTQTEVGELYRTGLALHKPSNNLGLLGYWSLNEATSTVATDFSGNGFHGSFSGNAVTWASGKRGSAAQFGGSSDYIATSDLNNTTDSVGELTISLWLYNTTLTAGTGVFGKWSVASPNWIFYTSDTIDCGSNDMAFAPDGNDGECTSGNVHVANTWEHWVIVYDGGQASDDDDIKMYLNGVLQADQRLAGNDPVPDTTLSNSNAVTIGDTSDGASGFTGIIDEVRVYNRALGPTEAVNLFGAGGGATRVANSSKFLQQGTTLGRNLVGHWSFDGTDTRWTSETSGVVYDASGNNNIATITNMSRSVAAVIGKLGQAFSFDNSDDYLLVADHATLDITGDITMAAWIRRSASGVFDGIFSKTDGADWNYEMYICGTGSGCTTGGNTDKLTFESDATTRYFSTGTITDTEWHHVAISRTGSTIAFYIDGAPSGTANDGTALTPNADPLLIGSDIASPCGVFCFGGSIDDARLYSRGLTAAEVKQLYQLGQLRIRQ